MMRHLEQIRFRVLLRHLPFRSFVGVSLQQGGCFSLNQFPHQRFIIAARRKIFCTRGQDADLGPAKVELIACPTAGHAHTQVLRLLSHLRI
jgi:hypothetical protein